MCNKWQPIETAPKDGTEVDLWVVYSHGGYRRPDCKFEDGYWWYGDVLPAEAREKGGDDWDTIATHWMPTPGPPKKE